MTERLLTKADVAQLLRVSPRTVDRFRARGELAAVKIRHIVRFQREAVEQLIADNQRR